MKVKYSLSIITTFLAVLVIFSTTTFAAENLSEEFKENLLQPNLDDFEDFETAEFTQVNNTIVSPKKIDIETLKSATAEFGDLNSIKTNIIQSSDPYEPNDTIDTATTLAYNQKIFANIGHENDIDWYKIYLTAGNDVAFLLKDIPSGVDYDLYIFDPNFNYAVSGNPGNQDEKLYINIQTSGIWYIAINPYSGYDPNQNYSLFIGNAWRNDSFQVTPSNMTFYYNSSNVGTVLPYQILDLRNEYTIPNSARVTGIQISTNNSTGNWGNQVKYIYAPQTATWYQTFPGLNVVLNLPQEPNLLFLKQQWAITSSIEILFTSTASWSPRITFNYKYLIE